MNKTINYTVGFLSGALLGSVVTLLYAPENGRDVRDTLSYRLNNYIDDASHLVDSFTSSKRRISDAKRQGDRVVSDAQKRAENLIKEAEELLSSIERNKKSTSNGSEI